MPAAKAPAQSPAEGSAAKAHYIWDMTFDAEGRLYIATGGPAAVYRVDVRKLGSTPEEFFHCDEAHIRALAWDANGNLIAGTDGSGLVYRISPAGQGYVLFEAPHREITSVAVAPDGTIYAANVGWINLGSGSPVNGIQYLNTSAADFGVNQDGLGNLRGYAWGANCGWINFESTGAPQVDLWTDNFHGSAWGAN